jgi:hypothetical protein
MQIIKQNYFIYITILIKKGRPKPSLIVKHYIN